MTQIDWSEAPCQGSDDFLPPRGSSSTAIRVRRAKHVCLTRCPIRRACLEQALDGIEHPLYGAPNAPGDVAALINVEGIWGGTTEQERRAVASLPRQQQLAVLESWLKAQTTGAFALADPKELIA